MTDNISTAITKIVAQTFYEHDIASGNITKVRYSEGFADQFFKRYNYDTDNRLIGVESSRDNVLWETDAQYTFYPHGPMRRTILGADSVQGIDYTYTIQGWLKAINHPTLDVQYDPGADGNTISGTTNSTKFGKDAFGMALGYFTGDFLHTSSPFHSGTGALTYNLNAGNELYDGTVTYPLYDGTISTQTSFIHPPVQSVPAKPVWPGGARSVVNTAYQIRIPKGTTIYIGKVAPQGGFYLGVLSRLLFYNLGKYQG